MRVVLFCHSLISDWNHGNAHFLRGIASTLLRLGHEVLVYEPADSWSLRNLLAEHGSRPITGFHQAYPELRSIPYTRLDLPSVLAGADLILVHEWNPPELVREVARARPPGSVLLFHDTHHRAVSDPGSLPDLSGYDGVLAFGEVLRALYRNLGWARRVWTWHEAADTARFRPMPEMAREWDLVWIGNWGDEERTAELEEFLIRPVEALRLKATVFGVRFPREALQRLAQAGIDYRGWLPNYRVPEVFARFRVTVHVPRRPYVESLRGIPTIRPFEAMACGIPLVCSPWYDDERLFSAGNDYLSARDGAEMIAQLRAVLGDERFAGRMASRALKSIGARHTCEHRVEELLAIHREVKQCMPD